MRLGAQRPTAKPCQTALFILYGVKNGAVPRPPVSAIKKHQSFFKPWCKRFYALAYALAGKPPKRDGTEYPDLVCGAKARPFRKAFPGFTRVTALLRQSERTYTLQCRFCVGDFHPVSLYFAPQRKAVFLNMPIFICKLIMNLFVHFVNTFTQKNSKNGSVPHRAHFEHAFLLPCSRCGGKMRPLSTE